MHSFTSELSWFVNMTNNVRVRKKVGYQMCKMSFISGMNVSKLVDVSEIIFSLPGNTVGSVRENVNTVTCIVFSS